MRLKRFLARPKTYEVTYNVRVTNRSVTPKECTLVIPVPTSIDNQTLIADVHFSPTMPTIKTDTAYGNKYASWQLNLNANEEKSYQMQFGVSVLPIDYNVSHGYKSSSSPSTHGLYLNANAYIRSDNPDIEIKAKEIIGNEKDVVQQLRLLNNYVVTTLTYGNPIVGLYTSTEALEKTMVDCGGYDSLLLALAQSVGIPGRIVSGFWAGYKQNEMHAWVEFLLPDGTWLPADPSIEQLRLQRLTKKFGALGKIGNDRFVCSVGCDIPLEIDGQQHNVAILQNPLIFPESAMEEIDAVATVTTK